MKHEKQIPWFRACYCHVPSCHLSIVWWPLRRIDHTQLNIEIIPSYLQSNGIIHMEIFSIMCNLLDSIEHSAIDLQTFDRRKWWCAKLNVISIDKTHINKWIVTDLVFLFVRLLFTPHENVMIFHLCATVNWIKQRPDRRTLNTSSNDQYQRERERERHQST